ncbi:hypothetical protein TUM19329_21820 [Legionella antarctica]|uniref:Uncharacterized protein n=1 Tax=Legionella antarctica TaxID=2708020 RepID=A0A6F8T5U1_9GAMM|nr:hypothetical protein TUM19329_21820 [Legionella antarctica]
MLITVPRTTPVENTFFINLLHLLSLYEYKKSIPMDLQGEKHPLVHEFDHIDSFFLSKGEIIAVQLDGGTDMVFY